MEYRRTENLKLFVDPDPRCELKEEEKGYFMKNEVIFKGVLVS